MSEPLLSVADLQVYYGQSHILQGVGFAVAPGTVLSVLGRNGAGKTTLLNAVMGVLKPRGGTVEYAGRNVRGLPPYRIAKQGIAYVPETRGIFPSLTVLENLTMAARPAVHDTAAAPWDLERVYKLFPRLEERRANSGGKLSGGEQQMLSIARALMTNPRLLILDEPTEGLAPLVVKEIEDVLDRLSREGLTMLLVEQNLAFATRLADAIVILGKGLIRWSGTAAELAADEEVQHTWLGV